MVLLHDISLVEFMNDRSTSFIQYHFVFYGIYGHVAVPNLVKKGSFHVIVTWHPFPQLLHSNVVLLLMSIIFTFVSLHDSFLL